MHRLKAAPTRILAILLLLPLLASCGLAARSEQLFEDAASDYVRRLRWLDFPGASLHLAAEHRQDFLRRFSALEELRIVEARLEPEIEEPQPGRHQIWLSLEYYLPPSPTVRQARILQEWRYKAGDRLHPGAWRIHTAFPQFP